MALLERAAAEQLQQRTAKCGLLANSCRSGVRLHLNSDAVDRLFGSVENPPEWLRRHVHDQTSLALPILDRPHDVSVRRQFSAIWGKIVYCPLALAETQ